MSLKSIIPNPNDLTSLRRMALLILSGALFLDMSLFHRNLYIKLLSWDSWVLVNTVVAATKSICDKPYVLKMRIFASSERNLLDQAASWRSTELSTLLKFLFLTLSMSKPICSPFTFMSSHGVMSYILLQYFMLNITSSLRVVMISVLSALSLRPFS